MTSSDIGVPSDLGENCVLELNENIQSEINGEEADEGSQIIVDDVTLGRDDELITCDGITVHQQEGVCCYITMFFKSILPSSQDTCNVDVEMVNASTENEECGPILSGGDDNDARQHHEIITTTLTPPATGEGSNCASCVVLLCNLLFNEQTYTITTIMIFRNQCDM